MSDSNQHVEFNLGCGTLIGLFLIVALAVGVVKDLPLVGRWFGPREDADHQKKVEALEERVRQLENKVGTLGRKNGE